MNFPASGTPQLSFFSVPRGQTTTLIRAGAVGAFAKTYRDTNMENANVVPTKMFKFIGMSISYMHEDEGELANPSDRDKIRSGGYLHFRIVDKDILYLPLVHIPESNPNTIAATATTVAATNNIIVGAAGGGGANVPMYRFGIPVTLRPYENFTLTLNWDGVVTLVKAVDILITLHALMRRPT